MDPTVGINFKNEWNFRRKIIMKSFIYFQQKLTSFPIGIPLPREAVKPTWKMNKNIYYLLAKHTGQSVFNSKVQKECI